MYTKMYEDQISSIKIVPSTEEQIVYDKLCNYEFASGINVRYNTHYSGCVEIEVEAIVNTHNYPEVIKQRLENSYDIVITKTNGLVILVPITNIKNIESEIMAETLVMACYCRFSFRLTSDALCSIIC
jgi:hypothetical protein